MVTAEKHAVHAVVADFRQREDVGHAIADLARVGFGPERVTVVAGDPELAREVGGRSYAVAGFVAGAALGIAFAALLFFMGGSTMLVNPVGFVIGALGTIGGLAFIGLVFGRSIVTSSPDAQIFADEVARGDVLLAVACEGEGCGEARAVLVQAGAVEIRDEDSPGPT